MVGCTWSTLHGISPFALDSVTLNFSYTETSTDVDMRRYFVELYCYITYCVSEHQCLVPVTLVRWYDYEDIDDDVIIFIASCTEQNVWVGNVWYLSATEVLESSPRHGIHCLRLLLFILSACSQRFGSRSVKVTTLTCTSFAEQEDCLISLFDAIYYEVLFYLCKSQLSSAIRSVRFLSFEFLLETNNRF